MYSICFTIAGVIFSILLFIIYSFKTNFSISENKIYHSIIITTIITGLIEIYAFILVKNNIAVDSSIYLYTLKLLFLGFVIWLYSFTLYTVIVTLKLKDKDNDKYRIILVISSIIFTILSIITITLPISINKVGDLLLPTGSGVEVIYLLAVLCFIIMIIAIISNHRELKNKKYYPVYFLLAILGIMILIQKIFPDLLLINFSLSIIIYIMYFTIENPDIKLSKELKYTKELLNKRNELASNTINNLIISIKEPLTEIANFSNKKINKNNISLSLEEIKELQKTTLSLVDKVNKVMDITRIESSDYSIKERKYQTSNLIDNIKGILEKNNIEVNYEISTLPKVLYGSDTNIVQTFSYLVDFISKNFENYTLSIKISNLLVRNKCHLKFSLVVDSKYNNLDMYEKDNKYTLSNKSIEYEVYEKLIDLQRGHNFISKDGSKVIFEFSLYQRQEEVKEINDNEEIEYFDASDKNVLVALNSHNDIRNLSELLMNYNVNITTAGSVNELNELLSSNKTFDLVFLSDHIYGIDNYDIKNTNDFKKTINKLSLVAGYKLEIVLVTLNDYQKENIEYLTLPISKTKLDDILVKYLNED
ncbi:hybrid sensory kinase [Firmicutes bacterium CAG:321]|nr:hybrid sensory kinase [Firmicutes bacterium CAG:321]